jgi:hypothetical protein
VALLQCTNIVFLKTCRELISRYINRAESSGENAMNEGIAPFFSPFTLLIGGSLVAIGFLSLFDLHFLKTPLRGKIALVVGLIFIVATEAMFATSSASGRYLEGQKVDLTECEFQTERDFPNERRDNPKLISEKITSCMNLLGYEWLNTHPHCNEAPISTNVFCYLPTGPMDRKIVSFQMGFE